MTQNTVPEMFEQAVSRFGNRTAMRKKQFGLWLDISWNEYAAHVRQVGAALVSMGFEKGQAVSIIGDNCPEWVFISMGAQCVGGVATGIYATNAWPQVEYVVRHSESRFLFVENEEQLDKWLMFRDKSSQLHKVVVWDTKGLRHFKDPQVMTFAQFFALGKEALKAQPALFAERAALVAAQDTAVLIYTSGTTGPPKGAMLSHSNLLWMGQAITRDNPMYETDEVLSFLPLCHIFEQLFTMLGHISIGYTVNFIESLDTVTENMVEISPTVGHAVPRIWEKYYSTVFIKMAEATWFKRKVFGAAYKIGKKKAELSMNFAAVPAWIKLLYFLAYLTVLRKLKQRLGFDRIRVAYSGAAPIAPDVLSFFQAIGVNLVEGYGQTEGTGVTCISPQDRPKFGSVGLPLQGSEVKIAEDGEILVKSPGVFQGYFKNQEATAETLQEGWLCSGDVGRIDDNGYLYITDRKKDIIVTAGGKNITPQYIENKLKSSIYINDAVVIGDRRKYLTALIMIDEDNVVKFAQDHKIQFSTYRDLTSNPEINKLIQDQVDQVNASLARVENIRKFTILPKKLYEEDGEVTPTMKVKRKHVHQAFADLIEAMYK